MYGSAWWMPNTRPRRTSSWHCTVCSHTVGAPSGYHGYFYNLDIMGVSIFRLSWVFLYSGIIGVSIFWLSWVFYVLVIMAQCILPNHYFKRNTILWMLWNCWGSNVGPSEQFSHSVICMYFFPSKFSMSLKLNKYKKTDKMARYFSKITKSQ